MMARAERPMLSVVVLCYRAGTTLPQVLEPLDAQ
jgi:hypothetical protein